MIGSGAVGDSARGAICMTGGDHVTTGSRDSPASNQSTTACTTTDAISQRTI